MNVKLLPQTSFTSYSYIMNGYVMNVAALAATSVHWLHRDGTGGGGGASRGGFSPKSETFHKN